VGFFMVLDGYVLGFRQEMDSVPKSVSHSSILTPKT
jgi:hypothetical protein